MTYAARADLEARYTTAEVQQLEASGRDIDQALADADAEINSYLGGRYEVPITGAAPERIIAIACDIARYRLFGVNSEGEPLDRYKAAIAWLRDVRAGKADVEGLTLLASGSSAVGIGRVCHGQAASGFDWRRY